LTRKLANLRAKADFLNPGKLQKEMDKLQRDLDKTELVFNREWLLEKVSEFQPFFKDPE
jgi:hypothetical protein